MKHLKFRKAAVLATAPVLAVLLSATPSRADTPLYSFETLYNSSDAADPLGTMPDDFRPSPSPALTSVTQSTIGATDGTHSMSFVQQAGATFTAALTKNLPTALLDANANAVAFDITIPSTGNFNGVYARIGISAFGTENDSPDPMNPFVDQVQAAAYSEQNISLDPGQTYHIILPNLMLFNPRSFATNVSFASCFNAADPNSLTLISWELYVNKTNDSGLSAYLDNLHTVTNPVAVWSTDGSANWSSASTWNMLSSAGASGHVVPNAPDIIASMNTISTSGARTVTMDQAATVGDIEMNGAGTMSIVGSGTLSLQVTSGQAAINLLKGNHTITAPLQFNSDTVISVSSAVNALSVSNLQPTSSAITKEGLGAATLNNIRAGAVTVNNGTLHVAANGTATGASQITSLTFAGGATPTASLNLNDNDLVLTDSSYSSVTSAIRFARNGGAWDKGGLTSYAARDATVKNKTLGTLTGAQFHAAQGNGTQFDGFDINDTDVLVKYTYFGDANFNGKVDGGDYVHIDLSFNNEHTAGNIGGWFNGDFDYNGKIDGADYGLIDSAFNSQVGTLRPALLYLGGQDPGVDMNSNPALALVELHYGEFGSIYADAFVSAVPEPGTLVLTASAAAAGLLRPRRRSTRNHS